MSLAPVPGRECGACNVCCKLHAIIDPELKKLPGVLCSHWTAGTGCSIYERRPETCVGHHCGWRRLGQLDESWRPDGSNIYIELKGDPPEHFRHALPNAVFCFRFTLLDAIAPQQLGLLATTIASLIDHDVPVVLALAVPPEHLSSHILLNPKLKLHAAACDEAFQEGFAKAIMTLMQVPPEKAVLD